MKIALIADIHGHLPSLVKCLKAIKADGIKRIICLGDIVNGEVEINRRIVSLLREHNVHCVIGNHDLVALKYAKELSGKKHICDQTKTFLEELPLRINYRNIWFTHICLGYNRKQLRDADNADPMVSTAILRGSSFRVCFVGHTHKSLIVDGEGNEIIAEINDPIWLDPAVKYIINPGAVDMYKPLSDQCIFFGIFDYSAWSYVAKEASYN